jgi:hypothetical protein
MKHALIFLICLIAGLLNKANAQDKPVYKCPGNLYTDALSAREAVAKGCKTLEGAPITIIQAFKPKPVAKPTNINSSAGSAPPSAPVNSPSNQKSRDADSRLILETELKKEEEALSALRKDYNNGQPERRGDERQSNKYNERVQSMKDAITRKEADVASIRRELTKLGVVPSPAVSSSPPARIEN